ncbi:MAG TPA: acyl-CoA dehydrogenase family protein [Acidimicrobiia bacterium]|nr:acyl-CoA dehydrogenase family protein [Acidimicrobiia bacterium]
MELEFTQDQDELRDSMRAVLAKECPVALARKVVEHDIRPDALWSTLTALGWPALTVSESCGGIGLGMIEAGILAEELGRVIAPGPLLPTVTQFVPVVREAGTTEQQERFLGAVAAGECRGTLAITETSGSFDPAAVNATVTLTGEEAVIDGEKRFVIEGDAVDELVVVAREPGTAGDDGVRAIVVPGAAAAECASRVDAFDASRRFVHLQFDGLRVERSRVLGAPGVSAAPGLRRAIEEATVALALETVGTAQTVFDTTLDYAQQREQFGAPIGSFQAIKHKFADMIVSLERARATGYFATLTIAEDDPRRTTATSVAKVAAGDCQRLLGKEGIQIHGGIGYTWEHDMHLYVKRMKSNEQLFGSSSAHKARIADLLGV